MIENAWSKSITEIAGGLKVELSHGLASGEAEERLKHQGVNSFGEGMQRSAIRLFLQQFQSPLIILLLLASLVTLLSHEYVDASFIILAVLVATVLGWLQEYKAERATAALNSYIEERVRVIRDGREQEIDARTVVVGDVVVLRSGERVPADGRLFETHDLFVDESILTGESLPVEKSIETNPDTAILPERTALVFGGTYVTEGQGRVIITATGLSTEFGKIAAAVLSQKQESTPLQRAVSKMSWAITGVALLLILFVYMLGLARGMEHVDIFLVAVAIAVGAIPEALPPGLTAILAVGVERIAKRRGIVRSLLAAETLGSATVVITDKTGTLTTGKLELINVLSSAEILGHGSTNKEDRRHLLSLAVANTNVVITDPTRPIGEWDITGRHLDVSIAKAAGNLGINVSHILAESKPIKLFSSAHKYSIFNHNNTEVVLGAPDILLAHALLSEAEKRSISSAIDELSHEGKRILGLGQRVVSGTGHKLQVEFLGILVFFDPLRDGITKAIKEIESSGVRVIMATGDLLGTGKSVAGEIGWEILDQNVLTGEAMRSLSDEDLAEAVKHVKVFARMTPEDKYHLIELLQAEGEVVAMLGDGVNDAPSLRKADIGVAVGSGTDVAKGVADLVLLDDDFHIIKAAIDEGKLILSNVRKVFVYLMSNCLDELILLGGSLALGFALPLSPLQVIWVNFATGSIPAMAYAFDREHTARRTREHSILSREVITLSFGIGLVSSALLLVLYAGLIKFGFDNAEGRTFLFACFASYILFVAFSFRNLHKPLFSYHPFSNNVLNGGVLLGLGLLVATVYLPFFQALFDTVALTSFWLPWLMLWLMVNIILVEAAKWIMVRT
ncbi:hypothetical protein A2837_02305 [Candidatus Kaiserbacteria bacterium RIFCSPHIGHO2_01_FULL_46_22]|uniref:Cation-transporting P-type ATPase N-terminal domain-containing protein n=1 Tax=Candidatus Kaiserbacteria bacterium RIFCSPHIGHO2_01_FULL_46_22 TaxID=1798475 RepID=A0A1F6BYI4_9BACT|nr:MAG: hypothetical protein A2837_02305 [Candidatus Kaiserbacteria bacterium RIFCSPHIGHO2_01_FULL_46_22]